MPNEFQSQVIRCSGPNCQETRKSTNHWFIISIDEEPSDPIFACWPLDMDSIEEFGLSKEQRPVCGQSCAQKLFEDWMTRQRAKEALA